MSLSFILSILQIVLAVFVVTAILLQQRGTGLGGAFGGGDSGNAFATRRGAERIIFLSTIIGSILFFAVAIAQNLL